MKENKQKWHDHCNETLLWNCLSSCQIISWETRCMQCHSIAVSGVSAIRSIEGHVFFFQNVQIWHPGIKPSTVALKFDPKSVAKYLYFSPNSHNCAVYEAISFSLYHLQREKCVLWCSKVVLEFKLIKGGQMNVEIANVTPLMWCRIIFLQLPTLPMLLSNTTKVMLH